MFKISFYFEDKAYTGTVQKINHQPVQFIVFGIQPWIGIPTRLVFISNPDSDQLIYQSFDNANSKAIRIIGESIFLTAHQQHINIHE